ncbi:RNA polymerase sigma factor [Chitinophaga lutea]
MQPNDAIISTLLPAVSAGNMPAFRRLYELLAGDLHHYIFLFTGDRADAEEILQDVFVKVWEKRETLHEIRYFRGYIFRMARNHVLNYLRSAPSVQSLPSGENDLPLRQPDPSERMVLKEYYRIARDAIERLPQRRREVFRLREEEGCSLDEIAGRLGISKSAVKQHLYAATADIRAYLEQYGISAAYLPLFCTFLYMQ